MDKLLTHVQQLLLCSKILEFTCWYNVSITHANVNQIKHELIVIINKE